MYFRNVLDHIHGILWLWSSFSVCKILRVTIYFSGHYQSNPIILLGKKRRKESKLTHTHTHTPFTLILIEPNSSYFVFHNSRRVKLKKCISKQWSLCFPPKGSDCVEHFNWLSDLRLPVWRVNFGNRNLALSAVLQLARMWINFLLKERHIFSKKERNKALNLLTLLLSVCLPQPLLTFFWEHLQVLEMFLDSQKLRKELDSYCSLVILILEVCPL